MRDIKWFIDQGLRLTDPAGPIGILDALNEQALPGHSHFSPMLLDFVLGEDSPDQSDEVLFLAHFMRDRMDLDDAVEFVELTARHGREVLAHPSAIPFYDAATLVGIAAVTQDPKWIDSARQVLPSPTPDINILNVLSGHGSLATLRCLRALRFTAPHTTITSNRALADLFIDMYVNGEAYGSISASRTLHLYLSTLVFLPQAIRENMAWIASEWAQELALAGHPLMVSSAVLINSNWDEITPVRPKEKKERK